MLIEDRGIIYDATRRPDHRRIAFFTGLGVLRSGTLLCAFQTGSGKHSADSTIGICRSIEGGKSWSEVAVAFDSVLEGKAGSLAGPALVEVEPGRLLLFCTWFDRSDPQRPLFDPVTEGILHSRQLLSVSADDGTSWSPWSIIPTPGLTGCATTGPVVVWDDGTLAFPFESFKEFDDPRPGRHGAWLLCSRDGGRSFGPPIPVAQHPRHEVYYWDQRLCGANARGEYIALFWTHDLTEKQDLPVHIRRGRIDGTGEPVRSTGIPGQISAPLLLPNGRLLAFVVDRSCPGTMTLWTSPDSGQTWPEQERLIIHTHDEQAALAQKGARVDFAEYWEDMGKWSFGHPAILPLDERRVLLAFYAGTPDRMSIHWCRVDVGLPPH
jgi:hypothetical protein